MLSTISSFFGRFSPSAVHHAWNGLSAIKLPSAKKVALVGVSCFALYKLYRLLESLTNRVYELERKTDDVNRKISNLTGQLFTVEARNKTLSTNVEEINTRLKKNDSGYYPLEEHTPTTPSLPSRSTPNSPTTKTPPLELFKKQFSESRIAIKHNGLEMTFNNYLMNTIFRIEEKPSCVFDQPTNTFILSYEAPKIVHVKQLPQVIWDKMSYPLSLLPLVVPPFLKITPGVQISKEIKVKFMKVHEGVRIVLDETSISLLPNIFGYTAHLKSILIPHASNKKYESDQKLMIEAVHNSSFGAQSGPIEPQLLVDIINLNFAKDL